MLRELERLGAGLASQEYGNYMSRLETAAGIGGGAGSTLTSAGSNAGAQGASAITSGYGGYATGLDYAGLGRASGIRDIAGGVSTMLDEYYRKRRP
jgi:hypothetical protein